MRRSIFARTPVVLGRGRPAVLYMVGGRLHQRVLIKRPLVEKPCAFSLAFFFSVPLFCVESRLAVEAAGAVEFSYVTRAQRHRLVTVGLAPCSFLRDRLNGQVEKRDAFSAFLF